MNLSKHIIETVRLDARRASPLLFPGNRWNWLPDLCNLAGFSVGAEIGVSGGRFSKRLCNTVDGLKMYAIDPWESYDESMESQWRMDRAHRRAVEKLSPLNCEIIKDYSVEAAKGFDDESLDFVHIDANRSYWSVRQDLTAWTAKVRPGGIVSGCCYYNYKDVGGGQVKDAVDWWTLLHDIDPWFVLVHYRYPSYLWVKA
jgi:hypothetical protein